MSRHIVTIPIGFEPIGEGRDAMARFGQERAA